MENADYRHFIRRDQIVDFQIIKTIYGPGSQTSEPAIFDRARRSRLRRMGNMIDGGARGGKESIGRKVLPDFDEIFDLPENIGAGGWKDDRFQRALLLRERVARS